MPRRDPLTGRVLPKGFGYVMGQPWPRDARGRYLPRDQAHAVVEAWRAPKEATKTEARALQTWRESRALKKPIPGATVKAPAKPITAPPPALTATRTFMNKGHIAYLFKRASGAPLKTAGVQEALRRRLKGADPDARVWVRGKGGRDKKEYERTWWSALPIRVTELRRKIEDPEDLEGFLATPLDSISQVDIIMER